MILTFELNAKLPAKWAFLYLTELTRPLRDPNAASRTQNPCPDSRLHLGFRVNSASAWFLVLRCSCAIFLRVVVPAVSPMVLPS